MLSKITEDLVAHFKSINGAEFSDDKTSDLITHLHGFVTDHRGMADSFAKTYLCYLSALNSQHDEEVKNNALLSFPGHNQIYQKRFKTG